MQFHKLRPGARAGGDLFFIRRDEQADFDAGVIHELARVRQRFFGGNHIQSAFSRHLQTPLRHHANDVRLQLEGDRDDLRRIRHFQIKPRLDDFAQPPDVAVLNMTPVLAQVRGDPMRASGLAHQRRGDGIRLAVTEPAITRLADRGHVINVDAKFEHEILF